MLTRIFGTKLLPEVRFLLHVDLKTGLLNHSSYGGLAYFTNTCGYTSTLRVENEQIKKKRFSWELEFRDSSEFINLLSPREYFYSKPALVELDRMEKMPAYKAVYGFLLSHYLLQISRVYAKVPAIIVFGDSSVDAGNNNQISTILKSNFPPYGRDFYSGQPTGRFSNGRIPPDFISEAFGIKPLIPAFLDPFHSIKDFATGVCFASAGTGYDNVTSDVLSVIPLWKELEYYKKYQQELRKYLGDDGANEVLGEALYLMSIGTNDFLENYYVFSQRSSEYSIDEYQNFLASIAENFITELYLLGARKISLGGLPPMGCLPLERTKNLFLGSNCIEAYNDVARSFNHKLQELVDKFNEQLVGIQLVLSNPYPILYAIIQNPESFGFETAATACCGTGLFEMGYMCAKINPFTCSDANQYVFWDAFHPTERTNAIIADHVFKTCLAQFQ